MITCHNVFNVWPKTSLPLPVWPRDAKGWTPLLEDTLRKWLFLCLYLPTVAFRFIFAPVFLVAWIINLVYFQAFLFFNKCFFLSNEVFSSKCFHCYSV